MNPVGNSTLTLRKDLESWLRGETAQEAQEELLAEADNILGGVPEEIQLDINEEEITEDTIEETEMAAEKFPVEDLPGPEVDFEAGEPYGHGKLDENENDKNYYENNKRPKWELLEEAGSRLAMRLRHIQDMRRGSPMYQRGGFRKSRGRFFALCVLVIIVIGTATALYRNAQRHSYDAMMEKARGLYGQEQYTAAFDAYHEASRRYPDRVEPLLGTAHAAERIGRVEEAIAAYRSCLERFPPGAMHSRSNVFYEIGRLYATLKAWDKAQESFEEAIAADAANYGAYFFLGDTLEEQGQPDKALTAYKRALDLSPSSDAAREAVKRVMLILPSEDSPDARRYVSAILSGDAALERKHYNDASRYFAEALAIRSGDAGPWVGFAEARSKLGDTAGAIRSLERALERDPEHAYAKSKLAEIKESQNKRNARPRRNTPPRSQIDPPPATTEPAAATHRSREALFDAGVELYRKGDYAASFHNFVACLHSAERGILPSASLAGDSGPIWRGFQVKLNVPSDARLLADAVRMNPMDRNLYVNILMAGTKMGMDRKTMNSALNEVRSHALLRSNNL